MKVITGLSVYDTDKRKCYTVKGMNFLTKFVLRNTMRSIPKTIENILYFSLWVGIILLAVYGQPN